MATNRKYPKSFYDDGLGDILEWIDDEVLVHSENKLGGEKRSKSGDRSNSREKKKAKKDVKLYGDNDTNVEQKYKATKRVRYELEDDETTDAPNKRLADRVRGLINRLAAGTMPFVTSEFEKLYSTNQRSSINASIFANIESSVISPHALTKRKLVGELMLLVSFLSFKISQDIGASLVHRLIVKFENIYATIGSDDDSKILDNIIICIVNLYVTGLISAHVIFELTQRICAEDFKPQSVELILLIIKSIGFQLRKDNPAKMRQLILMAQAKSKALKTSSEVGSRIEFMMEALGAIKNNNMSKLGNYGCDIDRDTIESTLKSLIKRTKLPECLADASFEEILSSPNWYLLDTRFDNDEDEKREPDQAKSGQRKSAPTTASKVDDKICKALGLNKPTEKTIFSALLRASDCVEASNVIIGFGLNHCSDAMLVCIHVAIHEKKYNEFHFNLINSLCKFNRKYKMAAKFSVQDKIRVLSRMASARVDIFKRLCFELIKSDAIPITILKAVEWADLSSSTKEYLVYLLENISDLTEEEKRKIMHKIDRKSSFAGAMRTFTNCFLKGCKLFQ